MPEDTSNLKDVMIIHCFSQEESNFSTKIKKI